MEIQSKILEINIKSQIKTTESKALGHKEGKKVSKNIGVASYITENRVRGGYSAGVSLVSVEDRKV